MGKNHIIIRQGDTVFIDTDLDGALEMCHAQNHLVDSRHWYNAVFTVTRIFECAGVEYACVTFRLYTHNDDNSLTFNRLADGVFPTSILYHKNPKWAYFNLTGGSLLAVDAKSVRERD